MHVGSGKNITLPQNVYLIMLQKFIYYIAFWRKREADSSSSINLKLMHGMNRISILMFLIAIIVLIIKYVF